MRTPRRTPKPNAPSESLPGSCTQETLLLQGLLSNVIGSFMPRPQKQNTHLQKARQEAAATCTVPVDVAAGFRTAPELTLQAPTKLAAHRRSTARSCQVQSHRSWKYVRDNVHLFDLRHEEGTEADCEDDYGGFHANFQFPQGPVSSDTPWGVVVRGTPAYDKKGCNNQEHICANSKHLTPLLHAIFSSLGVALQMQLIKPRVVALRGLTSLWHTDTNPCGANPVACTRAAMSLIMRGWLIGKAHSEL